MVAEQEHPGATGTEAPPQVDDTVDRDPLRADPEQPLAEPRHGLCGGSDRFEVARRRLDLDELSYVGEQQVEAGRHVGRGSHHQDFFGVARAPKWRYSSPVGSE